MAKSRCTNLWPLALADYGPSPIASPVGSPTDFNDPSVKSLFFTELNSDEIYGSLGLVRHEKTGVTFTIFHRGVPIFTVAAGSHRLERVVGGSDHVRTLVVRT